MAEPIDLGSWLVEHQAASYVMRVDGHSMADAGICDGNLIGVDRAKAPRGWHIIVALVRGDRTLKRLQHRWAALAEGRSRWLSAHHCR